MSPKVIGKGLGTKPRLLTPSADNSILNQRVGGGCGCSNWYSNFHPPFVHPMIYTDMPVIIPVLAMVYLLTIYLLLILAQRTTKSSRYLANSLSDAYSPYVSTESPPQENKVESSQSPTVQEASSLR